MKSISIIIADAQFLVRMGLRHLLKSIKDFQIVAEVNHLAELLVQLKTRKVDVLILDHKSLKGFGDNGMSKIRKANPDLRILIISADDSKRHILDLLEKGINSYLTKECEEKEIIDAVIATSKNEKFFCTKVLNFLLEKKLLLKKENQVLSPRELEIVSLVAKGKIARDIAAELNLSKHTVYTHRKNIMKKLELNSATELVLYAINEGILR